MLRSSSASTSKIERVARGDNLASVEPLTNFALVVGAIVIASFEGLLHPTLPDGSLKPTGFDGLVMPMHVVVGLAAALVIPPSVGLRITPRAKLRLPCVRWE